MTRYAAAAREYAHDCVWQVTARVRTVLGNLVELRDNHKTLLKELDRSEEMGSTLLIGDILEKTLMPLLMGYSK